jgi:hypothetical protein
MIGRHYGAKGTSAVQPGDDQSGVLVDADSFGRSDQWEIARFMKHANEPGLSPVLAAVTVCHVITFEGAQPVLTDGIVFPSHSFVDLTCQLHYSTALQG